MSSFLWESGSLWYFTANGPVPCFIPQNVQFLGQSTDDRHQTFTRTYFRIIISELRLEHFHKTNMGTLRYFDYISDSKVDMLLSQMPVATKTKVSAELGFNLTVLTGKIATERNTGLEDRVQRLSAVEKYLLENEEIGTLYQPKSYFVGKGYAIFTAVKEDTSAVFYFMKAADTYLALGGSAGHLIGAKPDKSMAFGLSHAEHLLWNLAVLDRMNHLVDKTDEEISEFMGSGVASVEHPWSTIIHYSSHNRKTKSFKRPISFLARKLVHEVYLGNQVILGSPLFVEQVDV